jgi:hypothetical protein
VRYRHGLVSSVSCSGHRRLDLPVRLRAQQFEQLVLLNDVGDADARHAVPTGYIAGTRTTGCFRQVVLHPLVYQQPVEPGGVEDAAVVDEDIGATTVRTTFTT